MSLVLGLLLPNTGLGQQASAGSITGTVVEAASLGGLAGATITVEPAPAGLVRTSESAASGLLTMTRRTVTDASGVYRLDGLAAGTYRMHVQALGYRTTTVELRVAEGDPSRLSIGLHLEPIALEPMRVNAAHSATNTTATGDAFARLDVERIRQSLFVSSDARVMTPADVDESLTLAEPDVFRALQRLPGVATRDDYSAEMWTRGAPWDQTAVYFDGVPLFNPLHASGAFSAINIDAISSAFFHPGVQPTELASAAAGVVDLRTRRGSPGTHGAAELSLLSGKLTFTGGSEASGVWMIAARRTHLDWLTRGFETLSGKEGSHVPYSFADVTGRYDTRLTENTTLEASALIEFDELSGDVEPLVEATTAHWGNRAARITFVQRKPGLHARHTIGWSDFHGKSDPVAGALDTTCCAAGDYYPTRGMYRGQSLNTANRYMFAGSVWEAANDNRTSSWSGGVRLIRQATHFKTRGYWPQRSDTTALETSDNVFYGVIWAQRAWRVSRIVEADVGLRLEFGTQHQRTGRAAPRAAVRIRPASETLLTIAAGRSYQHAQSVTPAGIGNNTIALSNLFWVLAGDSVPVLQSTVATIGAEQWLSRDLLFSATFYQRRASGVAVANPERGWLLDRALFVTGRNDASGIDLSLRRLAGNLTGSIGYSFGRSIIETPRYTYDAPSSRTHSFDAMAITKLRRTLRAGAALSIASGAAFTRYDSTLRNCKTQDPATCVFMIYARAPGAERAPGYRSLDLFMDWQKHLRSVGVRAYVQLQNVLGSRNAAAYQWSKLVCGCSTGKFTDPVVDPTPESFNPENNQFLPGLPRVPVVGLRVVF